MRSPLSHIADEPGVPVNLLPEKSAVVILAPPSMNFGAEPFGPVHFRPVVNDTVEHAQEALHLREGREQTHQARQ